MKSVVRKLLRYVQILQANRFRLMQLRSYEVLDWEELKSKKTPDTIFILGSSTSINKIGKSEWTKIEKHDSIGVNAFLFHPDHIPTFYWYECAGDYILDLIKFDQLDARAREYNDVPFLMNFGNVITKKRRFEGFAKPIRDNHRMIYFKELSHVNEKNIRRELRRLTRTIRNNGKIDHRKLIHAKASIGTLVLIASLLGYKNIVLPGVDLDGHDYFYFHLETHFSKEYHQVIDRINQREQWFEKGQIHRTARKDLKKDNFDLSIVEVLEMIQQEVLDEMNGQIFAYSTGSLLAESFPLYSFDTNTKG